MSQLDQLKQSVTQVANTARKTGSALSQYEKQLRKQTEQVKSTMGGSSQGKDREVMQALQKASKAVNDATASLQNAARVADKYAQSI